MVSTTEEIHHHVPDEDDDVDADAEAVEGGFASPALRAVAVLGTR